jgi:Stress responsive A/B Barrel Domain
MFHCCSGLRNFCCVLIGLFIAGVFILTNTQTPVAAKDEAPKVLRHVVLFKFKSTSSEADIKKVVDEFRNLPGKITAVADFEFGINNSPEGLADGFTHCFFITFKSEKDRETYLPHAAHSAFVEVLKPHLEKVLVIDYFAGK